MSSGFAYHVATAPGEGGIAVFELYGERDAFLEAHIETRSGVRDAGRATLGRILDEHREVIDDAIIFEVAAAESWSRLACLSLAVHGGPWIVRRIAEILEMRGARPCSRRDVLSRAVAEGALDAVRGSAYERLVESKTERAAAFFCRQYDGSLSREIETMLVTLDEKRSSGLAEVSSRIERLLARAPAARRLHEPLRVLLAGRPNAGKSTLLNTIAGKERVIVSASAGTTRDLVRETVAVRGFPVELADSAGLRGDPSDAVEAEAIARVHESFGSNFDLVIWLRAPPWDLSPEEHAFLARRAPEEVTIVVDNFIDLPAAEPRNEIPHVPADVRISALRGDGMDRLMALIADRFLEGPDGAIETLPAPFLRGQEHVLRSALDVLRSGGPEAPGVLDAIREALILCLRSVWD